MSCRLVDVSCPGADSNRSCQLSWYWFPRLPSATKCPFVDVTRLPSGCRRLHHMSHAAQDGYELTVAGVYRERHELLPLVRDHLGRRFLRLHACDHRAGNKQDGALQSERHGRPPSNGCPDSTPDPYARSMAGSRPGYVRPAAQAHCCSATSAGLATPRAGYRVCLNAAALDAGAIARRAAQNRALR